MMRHQSRIDARFGRPPDWESMLNSRCCFFALLGKTVTVDKSVAPVIKQLLRPACEQCLSHFWDFMAVCLPIW